MTPPKLPLCIRLGNRLVDVRDAELESRIELEVNASRSGSWKKDLPPIKVRPAHPSCDIRGPGIDDLRQPTIAAEFLRAVYGVELPAALMIEPQRQGDKTHRICALHVRFARATYPVVMMFYGLKIYADNLLGESFYFMRWGSGDHLMRRDLEGMWNRIQGIEPESLRFESGHLLKEDGSHFKEIKL